MTKKILKNSVAVLLALLMTLSFSIGAFAVLLEEVDGFEESGTLMREGGELSEVSIGYDIAQIAPIRTNAAGLHFSGFSASDFPFEINILDYFGGRAKLAVTSTLWDFDIEDFTILLADLTAPDSERIVRTLGGIFEVETDTMYMFFTSHEEDGIETYYHAHFRVIRGGHMLSVYVDEHVSPQGESMTTIHPFAAQATLFQWRSYEVVPGTSLRGEFIETVTSEDPLAFPVNNIQGGALYTFVGPRVYPIVNATAPVQNANVNLNSTVTASGTASIPGVSTVFRMAIEIVPPHGSSFWLNPEQLNTSSISRTFTTTQNGRHTANIAARSFPETDPRSASRNASRNFNVVSPPSAIPVTSVGITGNTGDIGINGTLQLNANVLPANATDRSVTWTSTNQGVATVNANGRVTGISAGTANIRVRTNCGGREFTTTVRVVSGAVNPAPVLTLNPTVWNPGSGAAVIYISLVTNVLPYRIIYNPDWVFASAAGRYAVRLQVPANTGASRSGIVTITAGGLYRNITVTQAGAAAPAPPPPRDVRIEFDFNDAIRAPLVRTGQAGRPITPFPTNPFRDGFTFEGWFNTPAATGGTQMTAGMNAPDVNTTFWARWSINPNMTVTFDANGGTVNPTTREVRAGSPVGTLPVPERAGYTRAGWFTARTGGASVTASWVINNHVTFFARWTPRPNVTVTFNANGGAVNPTSRVVRAGTPVGALPTPTRAGLYHFVGWYNTPNPTGGRRFGQDDIIEAATPMWARWSTVVPMLAVGPGNWSPTSAAQEMRIAVVSNGGWRLSSNSPLWLTYSQVDSGGFTINVRTNERGAREGIITVSSLCGSVTRNIVVTQESVTGGRVTVYARILHDSHALNVSSEAQMRSSYARATALFRNIFDFHFNLESVSLYAGLNPTLEPGCAHTAPCRMPVGDDRRCGADCDTEHCKSARRNLNLLNFSDVYKLAIVGYALCVYDEVHDYPETIHRATGGVGQLGGRNSIASLHYARNVNNILDWIIQHELGHNLGAWDGRCTDDDDDEQACTMRNFAGRGELCDNCKGYIWRHLGLRYG